MRLGSYACRLTPDSCAFTLYGEEIIHERHRHRYEFNCLYERRSPSRPARSSADHSTESSWRSSSCRPSLVRGRAIPPGVQVEAARAAPAVRRLRRGEPSAQDRDASRGHGVRGRVNGVTPVSIGEIRIGNGRLVLIAGPCVIESEAQSSKCTAVRDIARRPTCPSSSKPHTTRPIARRADRFVDPAGRGSPDPGAREADVGVADPDGHTRASQAAPAAEVVDVLQIPAFLSRQTDLFCGGRPHRPRREHQEGTVPRPARHAPRDREGHRERKPAVIITERGYTFGYNNLVVDMRAFPILRSLGHPVIYDVTHSLQLPGAGDGVTSGQAEFIEPMASAGVAAGVDGVFMEVHENPAQAKSDGQNALRARPAPRPFSTSSFAFTKSFTNPPGRPSGAHADAADADAGGARAGQKGFEDRGSGDSRPPRSPRRRRSSRPCSSCSSVAAASS